MKLIVTYDCPARCRRSAAHPANRMPPAAPYPRAFAPVIQHLEDGDTPDAALADT
jgi:hypothetical protein